MLRRTDIAPSALASLAIAVAIVAIMVPTCVMIGCSMSGGMMFVPFGDKASISSPCDGTYLFSTAPVGTVPGGAESTLLTLVAALVVAVAVVAPRMTAQPVRMARDGPPPPPEDPGDVRLRI